MSPSSVYSLGRWFERHGDLRGPQSYKVKWRASPWNYLIWHEALWLDLATILDWCSHRFSSILADHNDVFYVYWKPFGEFILVNEQIYFSDCTGSDWDGFILCANGMNWFGRFIVVVFSWQPNYLLIKWTTISGKHSGIVTDVIGCPWLM